MTSTEKRAEKRQSSWPLESFAFLTATGIASALTSWMPEGITTWQIILLATTVIALGLPHGALDPWIARRCALMTSPLKFHTLYLGLTALVIGIWWLLPAISLALFLLISAWHFSQDWRQSLSPPLRAGLGIALLALPAASHPEQVERMFLLLSGSSGRDVAWALAILGLAATPLMLLIAAGMAARRHWSSALEIAALVALGWLTPPLVYFTVYFCLLHSPRHFRNSLKNVYGSARHSALKSAASYTALTLLFVLPFALFLMNNSGLEQGLLQLVFIGLAALTVPHMILMARAGPQKKENERVGTN